MNGYVMTFKYHFLVATKKKKRDEEEKGEEWEIGCKMGEKRK